MVRSAHRSLNKVRHTTVLISGFFTSTRLPTSLVCTVTLPAVCELQQV